MKKKLCKCSSQTVKYVEDLCGDLRSSPIGMHSLWMGSPKTSASAVAIDSESKMSGSSIGAMYVSHRPIAGVVCLVVVKHYCQMVAYHRH